MILVSSKIKKMIVEKSGLKTSGKFLDELNKLVELQIDQAIENAKKAGNKTILESHLA